MLPLWAWALLGLPSVVAAMLALRCAREACRRYPPLPALEAWRAAEPDNAAWLARLDALLVRNGEG